MAFMKIEYIRRAAVANYGATRGEIGRILDDNGPMSSIADVIERRSPRPTGATSRRCSGGLHNLGLVAIGEHSVGCSLNNDSWNVPRTLKWRMAR